MSFSEPATTPAPSLSRSSASRSGMDRLGITVYGCEPDEADAFSELAPRLGVVPTITSAAVSDRTVMAAHGNRCVSVGHRSEVSRPTLRALKETGVEYISTRSIGFDHIDLATAREMGITVENVVYPPDGVADYTLMLILMAVRNAKDIVSSAQRYDYRLPSSRGRELRDMTVGVVGAGHIGTAVIERLRGFGCHVLVCTSGRQPAAAADHVSLDHLLIASDVVTLHLPLNAGTRHLIGRAQVETMKQGAFLVNTGRGALVDTEALIEALESGRLAGAAVDVLEGEEGHFYHDRRDRPVENPFLRRLQELPNAIVSPHTAYYTQRALYDTVATTLANCLSFARNRTDA